MGRFLSVIDRINQKMGELFSLLIYPMIAFTVYEVAMRYLFSSPTKWVFESTLFLYAASVVLGGGYTLKERGHVGMDVVYVRLSVKTRAILDLITSLVFFSFVGVLLYQSLRMAWHAWVTNAHSSSPWGPPIYPVMTTIPIGAFLLLIQGVAKFIRDLHLAVTGREVAERG